MSDTPRNEARRQRCRFPFHPKRDQYLAYVAECAVEMCEPHTIGLWEVHGCPTGPI